MNNKIRNAIFVFKHEGFFILLERIFRKLARFIKYSIFSLGEEQRPKRADNEKANNILEKLKKCKFDPDIPNNVFIDLLLDFCEELGIRVEYNMNFNKRSIYKGNVFVYSNEFSRTGAPVVTLDAVEELICSGYFVVAACHKDGALKQKFVDSGAVVIIDYELANHSGKKAEIIPKYIEQYGIWYITELICQFDLALLSCISAYNIVAVLSGLDIPVIWWIHDGQYGFSNIGHCMNKTMDKNIHVYCVGEYIKQILNEYRPSYDVEILNYGVSPINAKKSKSENNFEKNVVKFINVGTLEPRKGQDIFIKSLKSLDDSYEKKYKVYFVGAERMRKISKAVINYCDNNKNAEYKGVIPREDVYELYKECDCIVCTSRDDPMPVVLTECMALGKIIITSNSTGTAHYIKDGYNGFVFDIKNIEKLSEKIKHVIDNLQDFSCFKKRVEDIYTENFSMDIFKKNLNEIIEKHING